MPIHRCGRVITLLLVVMLVPPLLLPLAGRDKSKPQKPAGQSESPEAAALLDRVVANEKQNSARLKEFSPRVETYVQFYKPDEQMGDVPWNDAHFLGRLQFGANTKEVSFDPSSSFGWLHHFPEMLRAHLRIDNFAADPLTALVDNFDRKHYNFEPVRWEYLGDERCLAIDVHPRAPVGIGAFEGRIWVEDHNYAIVRVNGCACTPGAWRSTHTLTAGARICSPACGSPFTSTARNLTFPGGCATNRRRGCGATI